MDYLRFYVILINSISLISYRLTVFLSYFIGDRIQDRYIKGASAWPTELPGLPYSTRMQSYVKKFSAHHMLQA